jgi:glucosamine--fructose-6-phosphate aminotransferase (isomerizing)
MVINSLKQLQNRGYDSFGISSFINNKLEVKKIVCSNENYNIERNDSIIDDTFDIFSNNIKHYNSEITIGHTRWATHGGINIDNTHPHVSNNGNISLVHNGII